MKQLLTLFIGLALIGCRNENNKSTEDQDSQVKDASEKVEQERNSDSVSVNIEPISHATAVLTWDDVVIYLDPTGGAEAFEGKEDPSFILITDIHGDHMDAKTLTALQLGNTQIIAPQAVKDQLPQELQAQVTVLNNGQSQEVQGINIEAIPMYNLPEDPEGFHPKGRGNGYVLEKDGERVYIAGDTEAIPEMKNLQNIDVALVPMNLPYTMDVEQAAEGVLAFEPKQVYPYHFRGQDGFADVDKFKELINQQNQDIEVVMAGWYPEREQQ